jgi:membrane protease YdiL (CAAX protease family)
MSALAGGLLFLAGINPASLFHGRMPDRVLDGVLLYIIGGLIAPVAEEIFFRGVVYGYVRGQMGNISRRWAVPAALLVSTGLFVAAHQTGSGVPLPQLVGGLVFCLSYEIEKSLVTPIIIHSAGNMALFTLAFF